jgi:nucleotide-binding universal stress UspA family protein
MARTVAMARPFLAKAKEIHIVTVADSAPPADALRGAVNYLQLHYPSVASEVILSPSRNIGEVLLGKCEAMGGALLVMGAYSHPRWRERVFGGVTEHVLNEARVPVLMAH